MRKVKAGEIYMCELDGIGSEQVGSRPILICSSLLMCENSPNVNIIPLTSNTKKGDHLPTHCMLEKNKYKFLTYDSVTVGENITTIDKSRLKNKLGRISEEQLKEAVSNMKNTFD